MAQDDVRSYLEEALPYERFSVRLPGCEVPSLGDILRSIPVADVAAMQVCGGAAGVQPEPAKQPP